MPQRIAHWARIGQALGPAISRAGISSGCWSATRRALIAAGESFITETVFSHPSKALIESALYDDENDNPPFRSVAVCRHGRLQGGTHWPEWTLAVLTG